jgi:multicomponent Na+:H+ antiporter subunit D
MFAFTGLGFYLLIKKLTPKRHPVMDAIRAPHTPAHNVHHPTGPLINLDFDWFYRKGALVFMWIANNPLNALNEFVSNIYQNIGCRMTMVIAKVSSWFDWNVIDGLIDNSASGVVAFGDLTRRHVTGNLQHYIGGSVACVFVILAIVIFT